MATRYNPKKLLVEGDEDKRVIPQLIEANGIRWGESRDTWIVKNSQAAFDAPYVSAAERKLGKGAAAIFDCTWPLDWDRSIAVPPKVNFELSYPE